jgi:hypothetical protein
MPVRGSRAYDPLFLGNIGFGVCSRTYDPLFVEYHGDLPSLGNNNGSLVRLASHFAPNDQITDLRSVTPRNFHFTNIIGAIGCHFAVRGHKILYFS